MAARPRGARLGVVIAGGMLVMGAAWALLHERHERAPVAPLDVRGEVSGCAGLVVGPPLTCELAEERMVRVVVAHDGVDDLATPDAARISFAASSDAGSVAIVSTSETGSETRLTLRIPPHASRLMIDASIGDRRGGWAIAIADAAPPPWLVEARAHRRTGRVDEARALAAAHEGEGGASAAFAKGLIGRLAMSAGDFARASNALAEAAASHAAMGRVCDAGADREARVFLLVERMYDLTAARTAVEEMQREAEPCADVVASAPYYRFLLARALGDMRGAMRAAESAYVRTTRLGLVVEARAARNAMSLLAAAAGRTSEACALTRELVYGADATDKPCDRASFMTGLAVLALDDEESADAGKRACPEDARALLDGAIALGRACGDEVILANAHVELARARLHAADFDGARAVLAAARAGGSLSKVEIAFAYRITEGELELASGHPRAAIARFEEAETMGQRLAWPAARARAASKLASAFEATLDSTSALAAYARAESALDDGSLLVPLGAGRSTFVASHAASARGRIALLAARGDASGALDAIEQARARLGRGLALKSALARVTGDGGARWEAAMSAHRAARAEIEADAEREWLASADAGARVRTRRLASEEKEARDFERALGELVGRGVAARPDVLRDDALVLAYHPARSGWVGVAARRDRALVHTIAAPDPAASGEALAAIFLVPFETLITDAARVRFALPAGAVHDVTLHVLPWHGRPLVASVEVEHSIATAPLPGGAPCEGAAALHALVVSDPNGDLPAARAESAAVIAHLRGRGVDVEHLAQTDATGPTVREALSHAQLFHYAGHATPATDGAWEGALALHGSTTVDVADVLALRNAPACVFLSSCEGARSVGDGFGMGQAFVFAGAHAVVAATRRVDDHAGRRFAEDFYAALRAGDGMPTAFAAAERAALARGDLETAAAYRLLVP